MTVFVFIAAFLLSISTWSQGVFECSLSLGAPDEASLVIGKLWMQVEASGDASIQTALSPFGGYTADSGRIEFNGTAIPIELAPAEERVYSGCLPFGPNPYLELPIYLPPVTCAAILLAEFHRGTATLNSEAASEIFSERATVRIELISPNSPAEILTISGILQYTGVIDGRAFTVTSIESAKLVSHPPVESTLRVSWAAEPGEYLVQTKSSLAESNWESAPFVITATSSHGASIDLPLSRASQFVRVLSLH